MTKKNETVKKLLFAVVQIGGHQHLVEEGVTYSIKKVDGDKGSKYVVDSVLMAFDGDKVKVGKPFVDGAKVEFEVASQTKDKKVDSLKYTAKSRVRRRHGSRALITKLLVKKIVIK